MPKTQKSGKGGLDLSTFEYFKFKRKLIVQNLLVFSKITEISTLRRYKGSDLLNKTKAHRTVLKNHFFLKPFDNFQILDFNFLRLDGYSLYNFYQEGLQKNSIGLRKFLFLKDFFLGAKTISEKAVEKFVYNGLNIEKSIIYFEIPLFSDKLAEKPVISWRKIPQTNEFLKDMAKIHYDKLMRLSDNLVYMGLGSLSILTGYYDSTFEDSKEFASDYRTVTRVPREVFYKKRLLVFPEILELSSTIKVVYPKKKKVYALTNKHSLLDFPSLGIMRDLCWLPSPSHSLATYLFLKTSQVRGVFKNKYWISFNKKKKNYKKFKSLSDAEVIPFLRFRLLRGNEHDVDVPEKYKRLSNFYKTGAFSLEFRVWSLVFSLRFRGKLKKNLKGLFFNRNFIVYTCYSKIFEKITLLATTYLYSNKVYTSYLVFVQHECYYLKSFIKFIKSSPAEKRIPAFSKKRGLKGILDFFGVEFTVVFDNSKKNLKVGLAFFMTSPLSQIQVKFRNWVTLTRGYSFKKQFHKQIRPLNEINLEKSDWDMVYWRQTERKRTFSQIFARNSGPFRNDVRFSWTQKALFSRFFLNLGSFFSVHWCFPMEMSKKSLFYRKKKNVLETLVNLEEAETFLDFGSFFSKNPVRTSKKSLGSKFVGIPSGFNYFYFLKAIPSVNSQSRKINPSMSGLAETWLGFCFNQISRNLLGNLKQTPNLLRFNFTSVFNDFSNCIWPKLNRPLSKVANEWFSFWKVKTFSSVANPHSGHAEFFSQQVEGAFAFKTNLPFQTSVNRLELASTFHLCFLKSLNAEASAQKKIVFCREVFEKNRKLVPFLDTGLEFVFSPVAELGLDYVTLINLAKKEALRESPLKASGTLSLIIENKKEDRSEMLYKFFTSLKYIKRQLDNEKHKTVQRIKRKRIF